MNKVPMDLLMYVAVFAAIMLFNYVSRRIAEWQARLEQEQQKKQKQRQAQKQVLAPKPRDERVPPPAAHARRTLATVSPAAPGEPTALSTAVARRSPEARSFLTGRRNLQRAIVSMTVLGPCRAQQPPHM